MSTEPSRKHLTPDEVARLIEATRGTRHEARDRCLLLLTYRHGLRCSEACGITLADLDLAGRTLHVRRSKNGLSTTHPLRADELRAIRAWLAVRKRRHPAGDTLFVSQQGGPLRRQTVWHLIHQLGQTADLPLEAHPHQLRHACGYALADQGADTRLIQDYLGHRQIQSTVVYTATNPARFDTLWRKK